MTEAIPIRQEEVPPCARHSIVPRGSVAGTALTLVVAIMAFLASLTLGAVSMVSDTARSWQSDIAREITVQVRPLGSAEDLRASVEAAMAIIENTPGITSVTEVADADIRQLLEPWLGAGLSLDELPVPRLLRLTIDASNPPDLTSLALELSGNVPGASLDDHRTWQDRLTTMAQATVLIGAIVFILMLAATVLSVIFATRGAMASNRATIDVLHFVGAERGYIASQFQRHFLLLGLKGSLAGGGLAIFIFAIAGFWASRNVADPVADQAAALFGTFQVGLSGYIGVGALIIVIALLTAITSRLTVLAQVGGLDASR
jgi:cell division transport system permease protein